MDVPQRYWRFPTDEAINSLADRFNLPLRSDAQDWEIRVADAARLLEFLAAFEGNDLTEDERFALAEVLMHCFDVVAGEGRNLTQMNEWKRFVALLRSRPSLHAFTLCYWSAISSVSEGWSVSPLIRPIWEELEPKVRADESP